MLEKFKNDITNQVTIGEFKLAFSTAEAYIQRDSPIFNDILHLKGKYNLVNTQRSRSLITMDYANVEISKISFAMLELLGSVKESDLVSNNGINEDYQEDWGFFEYLDEYNESQQSLTSSLENIKVIQEKYSKALRRTNELTKKIQNENKKHNYSRLKSLTKDMARDIHLFIDGYSFEMKEFDTIVNRNTYSSFKLLEFTVVNSKNINLKSIRSIKSNIQKLKKSMKEFVEGMQKIKASYDKKIFIGKELNRAKRRASKEHKMFIEKFKKCYDLYEKAHKNISLLEVEYKINNSFVNQLLALSGLKYRIKINRKKVQKLYLD